MNRIQPSGQHEPDDSPLITKAFLRAADLLGLTQKDMSDVLGISEAGVSRLVNQDRILQAPAKEQEIALLFIRLFRSLGSLLGGRETEMRKWLEAPNRALAGVPRETIKTLPGLFHAVEYLDAMRGKV